MLITWASQQYKGSGSTFQMLVDALFASGAPGAAWDLTDPARLWTDTAGTTPAGMGDYVARVDDLTGRGQHLLQGALPSRPQRALLPNGLPSLFFDGADDSLKLSSLDLTATDKVTIFVGVRLLTQAPKYILRHNIPGNLGIRLIKTSPDEARSMYYGSRGSTAEGYVTTAYPSDAPISLVVVGYSSPTDPRCTLDVNGVTSTATTTQGATNYANSSLEVGRYSSSCLYGYVTCVGVIGRALTSPETVALKAAINAQIGAY